VITKEWVGISKLVARVAVLLLLLLVCLQQSVSSRMNQLAQWTPSQQVVCIDSVLDIQCHNSVIKIYVWRSG